MLVLEVPYRGVDGDAKGSAVFFEVCDREKRESDAFAPADFFEEAEVLLARA